jgi:hypothetical protein
MGLFTMPSQAEKARHCCVNTLKTDGIFQQCSQRGILQLHGRLLWPLQQPTRASLLDSAAHPTACCAGFMMLCHIHLLVEVSTLSADCICPAKCAINPLCFEALVVQQQPFVMRHMCMQWAVAKRVAHFLLAQYTVSGHRIPSARWHDAGVCGLRAQSPVS